MSNRLSNQSNEDRELIDSYRSALLATKKQQRFAIVISFLWVASLIAVVCAFYYFLSDLQAKYAQLQVRMTADPTGKWFKVIPNGNTGIPIAIVSSIDQNKFTVK